MLTVRRCEWADVDGRMFDHYGVGQQKVRHVKENGHARERSADEGIDENPWRRCSTRR